MACLSELPRLRASDGMVALPTYLSFEHVMGAASKRATMARAPCLAPPPKPRASHHVGLHGTPIGEAGNHIPVG